MKINILKLHAELLAAGLPVISVRGEEPYADYERELTPDEKHIEAEVFFAHDGKPDKEKERIEKLQQIGVDPNKLLMILVDKVFNAKEPDKPIKDLLEAKAEEVIP